MYKTISQATGRKMQQHNSNINTEIVYRSFANIDNN